MVWTVLLAIIMLCISPEHISIKRFFSQLLMIGHIDGQTHLWFLPVLVFCYLILPIFEAFKNCRVALITILLFIFGLSIIYLETYEAKVLWIATYYIGYLFGRWPSIIKTCAITSAIMCSFALFKSNNITSDFKDCFILGRTLHVLFAVFFVTGPLYISKFITNGKVHNISILPPPKKKKIRHFIGREYEVYLVHQTYILGPLSVIGHFNNFIDILFSISLIILSAAVLIKANKIFDIQLSKFVTSVVAIAHRKTSEPIRRKSK
jgi:hypothetical protein